MLECADTILSIPKAETMDLFSHLNRQTRAAYLVITGLLIAIVGVLWIQIDKQDQMAHLINLTGKQRMYSQRIVMLSQTIQMNDRSDLLPLLRDTIGEMRSQHEVIKTVQSPQIQSILYGIRYEYDKHVTRYLAEADAYASDQNPQSLEYLFLLSDHMLSTADAMVLVAEQEYGQLLNWYKYVLIALAIAFVAVLFLIYRFIISRSLRDASELYDELKYSEAKIRGFAENTHALIAIRDFANRYRFVNGRFAEMAGKPSEEIIGKTPEELFGTDIVEPLALHDFDVIRTKRPTVYVETLSFNGEERYFSIDKFLLFRQDGTAQNLCMIATDITEQVRLNRELETTQKQLVHAQRAARFGSWSVEAQSRRLFLSENAAELFPIDPKGDFPMLDDLIVRIIDVDLDRVLKLFEDAMDYGVPFSAEFHARTHEGVRIYKIVVETDKNDGEVHALFGILQDITDQARDRERTNQYIKLIEDNVITSQTNVYGNITYVSSAFSRISGYAKEELIGNSHRIVRHPDTPAELFDELWGTIASGETWSGEIKNRTKNGGAYWVHASISPNFDYDGEITGYTAVRQDITDKKRIEELSITDPLTGLYNRRYFNDRFDNELNRTLREDRLFAFVLLDVDHFKKYNDTYGHQEGDHVLQSVANALAESFQRANDTVFRLGGEEFGILCSAEDDDALRQSVERAREGIESLRIGHVQNAPSGVVTASFGVAVLSRSSEIGVKQIDVIYKAADDQLYEAKNSGRNRVCIHTL